MLLEILAAKLREALYWSLISRGPFSEEQKQCHNGTRETSRTEDLLYFDQDILKESKMRWKNLTMVLIDNKKAFSVVPDSWIIDRFKMYQDIRVINFIEDWRCPWCHGYRHRKWTRRHEFKSWTRLMAFHIALIPLGKVWIQLLSLQLWVNSRTD